MATCCGEAFAGVEADRSFELSKSRRIAASEHVHEHLCEALKMIRGLCGEMGHACVPAQEAAEVLERLIDADLPAQLLTQLPHLEFEARKDVMNVCSALLRPGLPQHVDRRVVSYLRSHPTFFSVLIKDYCVEDLALHSGVVLRSCARHVELVESFLKTGKMFDLINFAQSNSIEVSSDAFCTLREMLIEHKATAARWLEANSKQFFQLYNRLLKSDNYCVERQAQKLLVDLFLDKGRHFQKVMMLYISSEDNLAINMNLLKDRSKVIQVEAFQLFKVFVGNPQKPPKIQRILFQNKEKIRSLLTRFPSMKPDDAKFGADVKTTIETVDSIVAPSPSDPAKSNPRRSQLGSMECVPFSRPFQGQHWSPPCRRVLADTADDIDSGEDDLH